MLGETISVAWPWGELDTPEFAVDKTIVSSFSELVSEDTIVLEPQEPTSTPMALAAEDLVDSLASDGLISDVLEEFVETTIESFLIVELVDTISRLEVFVPLIRPSETKACNHKLRNIYMNFTQSVLLK